MKSKVYQTNTSKGSGNCMQACMATMMNIALEKVPNFIKFGDEWQDVYMDFLVSRGYSYDTTIYNPKVMGMSGDIEEFKKSLQDQKGINGYFEAAVYSPKFFDVSDLIDRKKNPAKHAVVVDKNLNIVHDPNPEYKDLEKYPLADVIGFGGITDVYVINPSK